MSTDLIALDPSILKCGVAAFRDGKLIRSDQISTKSIKGDPRSYMERARAIGMLVLVWCDEYKITPRVLAAEWPHIRRESKALGDPNKIVPLAGVCSYVSGALDILLLQQSIALEIRAYLPSEWTATPKNKRKPKDSPRARRIHKQLSVAELPVWDRATSHDEIDAIGIGLHALGRLTGKRVYPGAR